MSFKKLILLMAFIVAPAHAARLQIIDLQKWSYVYLEVAPKIRISCDCEVVTNTDGTESVTIHRLKSLRQVGRERACVVGGVSDFFKSINGVTQSLLNALWSGGGASWNSWDNGISWYRMVPGNMYLEAPDPWCLQ